MIAIDHLLHLVVLRSIYTLSIFACFDTARPTQYYFHAFFDIFIQYPLMHFLANALSMFVRFQVEQSSIFATNYVRQLRNWLAGLAVL